MMRDSINALKKKFKDYQIDGYIIPKNDNYFSEYASNDRLKKINYLFVDGRYTLQANQESSNYFKIIEIHKKFPNKIIKNLNLGYDPSLFTKNTLKKYFSNNNVVAINNNLIDQIFKFNKIKTKPFFSLNKKVVGESHHSKISKVVAPKY